MDFWENLFTMAFGALNLSYNDFWEMTPSEIYRLFDAWQWRDRRDMHRLAWQTAYLMNVQLDEKNRVTIKQLLGEEQPMTEVDKYEEFEKLMELQRARQQNANL